MFSALTPRGGRRGFRGTLCSLTSVLITVLAPLASADVVINELLYRPGTAIPEYTAGEFIELHNTGPSDVPVGGWQFTKGISFTIPQGTTVPAGGFLVVAADAAAFSTQYPAVTNVVGGWSGQLSNSGERIELADPTGKVIDSVKYAEEGDWAVRTGSPTTGWVWTAAASNTGNSLELRTPTLPRDRGQNWAASAMVGGTPGAVNSRFLADSAPLIGDVRHSPALPSSAQTVTISCVLEDETPAAVGATLFWRDATSATTAPFLSTAMSLGSDGRFSAAIPAQAPGTVVEFYVSATDGTRSRTWPAHAASGGQTSNAVYQVNTLVDSGSAPHYRLVMTGQELATHNAILSNNRSSDTQVNTTLIASDPGTKGGYAIRYQCGLRLRGNSSRSYTPPPIRLNIPADNPWDDVFAMNLNTKYPWLQVLGMRMLAISGIETSDAKGVRVSINGVDRATNPTMSGLHAYLEPLDSQFVKRHFPNDSGGNLYHKRSSNTISGFSRDKIRWGVVNETTVRYNTAGWWTAENWDKDSNTAVNDWTDLTDFVRTMHTATGPTYKDQVAAKINIEQWLRWLAVMTLLNNYETNPSNGIDDDYSIYRGELDQRFVLIPHDLDTIVGQGDTIGPATGTLFPFVTNLNGIAGDDRIPQLDPFIAHPEIRARYLAIIKELLDGRFSKAEFDAFVANHLGGWVSASTQNAIISWMDQRRTYALGIVNRSLSVSSALTIQNGFRRATTATTSLSGNIDIASTKTVKVNGVDAVLNVVAGTWSLGSVTLLPGINRVTVQSFDSAGNLLETRTIDIWYDTGVTTPLPQTISGDVTLTAAAGPYVVTGEVVIAAGAKLTVEAGTNLWFAPQAQLTARGVLRMLGSQFAHVRCCPDPNAPDAADPLSTNLPAGPPKWNGIRLVDSPSALNVIQWTDILHAQDSKASNQGSIGVIRSRAVLDRLTFAGTHLRMIYTDSSWVEILNSVFPDMFGPTESPLTLELDNIAEHIKGTGTIPAGGAYIIRGNTFGTNKGHNDIIDVSSGRRPAPIVQILDNVFTGVGDEQLDLDGDVFIAGNFFTKAVKDPESSDAGYSSGISTSDFGTGTTSVIVRNVFYDVDHALNLKIGAAAFFENNTVVKIHPDGPGGQGVPNVGSAINLYVAEPGGQRGDGAFARDNIFVDAPRVFGNADLPSGAVSKLGFTNNLITAELALSQISAARPQAITTLGAGNFVSEPQFVDPASGDFTLVPDTAGTGAGSFGQDVGAAVPSGIFVTGEPISPSADGSATLRVGGPGIFAYRYRVNGGQWSADLPIGSESFPRTGPFVREGTINLSGLSPGTYTVEVAGRDFAGNWQTVPTVSRTWAVSPSAPRVILNEILADNRSAYLSNGAYPDYIELYNPGATDIDIGGKSITDDPLQPAKYVFPTGTTVPARGFLVLLADTRTGSGVHLGFALSSRGGSVYLYDAAILGGALLDSITYGLQIADYSIGRTTTTGAWNLNVPSPGGLNRKQELGTPALVRINEWLAASEVRLADDFLELYNGSSLPVSLSGMKLSDEPFTTPSKHVVPALSFISGRGFAIFRPGSLPSSDAGTLPFSLSASAETISLRTKDGQLLQLVDYDSEQNDISQGLMPDGGSLWRNMLVPSPGASNLTSGAIYDRMLALLNGLRISEVMYQPGGNADLEFVELVNIGSTTLDLTGVRFTDGVDFVFPAIILTPGSRVIVAKDPALMRSVYGDNLNIAGQFSGRLDNSGEKITLSLPAPYDVAILSFRYSNLWAPLTAGAGRSLQFGPLTGPLISWSESGNWSASPEDGGNPPRVLVPVISSALAANSILGDPFTYQILAENNPASFNASGLPAGLTLDPLDGTIRGTPTVYGTFPVQITASNSAGSGAATLNLVIAASGPVASFVWDTIPSPQIATVPFSASLRAVDAKGRIVRDFTSSVDLRGPSANPTFTVGTGTSTWGYPMATSYEDARTQTIYLASDINRSGKISALALYVGTPPGQTLTRWTIRMKHTPLSSYPTGASWEATGWTTVYQANTPITATGWVTFTFTQPFDYDGTSNLMVDYSFDGSSFSSDGTVRYTSTPGSTRTIYYKTDSGLGDPLLWDGPDSPTPSTQTRTPNVRLTFESPANVVTPDSTGGFTQGEWTGPIQIAPGGSGLRITADDGAGHTGISNVFTAAPIQTPVITSPTSAIAVAGQPFSYRITATGPATSYNATNLPSGLTFVPNEAVIRGTISNPGNHQISLSATNTAGTGTMSLALEVQSDSDGDGLPDPWETAFGLNPLQYGDQLADSDGDGSSNLAEFFAGTGPRDQASVLVVTQVQATGTNRRNFAVTWKAIPGKRYRVLSRPSLSAGDWIELTPDPINATGPSCTFVHSGAITGATAFYRVEIVP